MRSLPAAAQYLHGEHLMEALTASAASALEKVFLDHPHAVGESYWQHQRRAMRFGTTMVTAGVACLIHALIPVFFVRTASSRIQSLHEEMTATRRVNRTAHPTPEVPPGYTSALQR